VVSTAITVIAGYESINTGASLARTEAQAALSALRRVVVDKWHKLPGNKRGVRLQWAKARCVYWWL
jgi:Lhr-like helicase